MIDYFLRQQHLNKDFLQRFLAFRQLKKSVPSVCSVDYSECPPWKIDLSALCTLAKISLVSTRLLGISMKAWKTNSLPTTSME